MIKKHRRIALFTLLIYVFTLYMVPVSADTLDDRAKALNTLSILRGDGGNFNLGAQLKRGEAATFMVRMLGQENHVLANKEIYSNSKFPDVKAGDWFVTYVEFCTQNGIIAGYPSGKFGPNDFLSEKAALTMILKSMGYKWDVDFNWDTVYQKAYSVGIVKDSSYLKRTADNIKYTRGNLVNALYETLTLKKNGSGSSMLEDLMNLGVITKDTAKAAGFIKDSIKTSLVSVQAIDLNRISIKFNEIIGGLAVTDITIYEAANIQKKLTLTVESQNGNEFILKTSGQTEGADYRLEIAKVVDTEGFVANSLVSAFKGFRIPEVKSDYFKISKVEPIDKKSINVYFTHPINVNAEYPSFYELTRDGAQFVAGSPQSLQVKVSGTSQNCVMLYLKEKEFTDSEVYSINIKGDLTSAYSVRLNEGTGDKASFTARAKELEALKISSVTPLNNNTLMIEFNRDIDTNFAEKRVNYTVKQKTTGTELTVNSAAVMNSGDRKGRAVVVALSGVFDKTKEYELTIEYLPDRFKETYLEEAKYTFFGYYPDRSDIGIQLVTALDAGTIMLYTDHALDAQTAVITSNYVISSTAQPSVYFYPTKVYYDPVNNPNILKLYLSPDRLLNSSGSTYILRVQSTLKDSMGNMSSKTLEYGFYSSGSTTAKPIITEAVIIAHDTIKVKFNKDIALDVPNILNNNYQLEYKQGGSSFKKIPTGVNYYDGTTLILKFDSLDPSIKYTLSFESLKDYVGNIRTAADGQNTIEVRAGK